MPRKPIQIVVLDGQLVTLCDDGTMWVRDSSRNGASPWMALPQVPDGPLEEPRISFDGENRAEQLESEPMSADAGGAAQDAEHGGAMAVAVMSAPRTAAAEKNNGVAAKTRPQQAPDADTAAPVSIKYWVALAVCVAALGVTWGWGRLGRVDANSLAEVALNGPTLQERINAAVALAGFQQEGITQLRLVAAKSTDPEVLATTLRQLANRLDMPSVPLFLDALDNPDPLVREVGVSAVTKLLIRPDEMGWKADESAEKRAEALAKLRVYYKQTRAKPGD